MGCKSGEKEEDSRRKWIVDDGWMVEDLSEHEEKGGLMGRDELGAW